MKRILIAYSEAHVVRLIRDHLASAGYAVVGTSDGEDALFHLQTERFDLLICGHALPGFSGLGLLLYLRAQADARDFPIIMLRHKSARIDWEQPWRVIDGRYSLECEWLCLPFAPQEMRECVNRLLEGDDTPASK